MPAYRHFCFRVVSLNVLLACVSMSVGLLASAQPVSESPLLSEAQITLIQMERQLKAGELSQASELKARLLMARATAMACIKDAELASEKLGHELSILYPEDTSATAAAVEQATAKISPAIAQQRRELQGRKTVLEARLAQCKLMFLRANNLQSQLDESMRRLETQRLLARGPSMLDVLRSNAEASQLWLEFVSELGQKMTGWHSTHGVHVLITVIIAVLGAVFTGALSPNLKARVAKIRTEVDEVSGGLTQSTLVSFIHYAPGLLALGGTSIYLTLIAQSSGELAFLTHLSYGLLTLVGMMLVVRTLLNPCPPAVHFLPLSVEVSHRLARRIIVLAMVVFIWWLSRGLQADGLLSDSMFLLIRKFITLAWVLNVIWMVWLLRRLEGWRDRWMIPVLLSASLLGGLIAGWIGYTNLATLILVGITNTLLLFGLVLLCGRFFSDIYDGLDEGRYRWQRMVRRSFGLSEDQFIPGLGWLRLLTHIALWVVFVLLVLGVWGAHETISDIIQYYEEGFLVAGLTIVPSQVLWAILILSLLLALTSWFKERLSSRWLLQTRMERSAREALVTTFGYVAVALAVVMALSIAGITFTNLAIIAGALSVGIGFGLQNVVNNFVSGIIMLVERPVRNGDWIVVGETEGYVQQISIRTTTIRTFDSADVIVPNSDLISGQVTNWTLRNAWGRIKVPIGVAYGTNTDSVREILLQIAHDNTDVIAGNPVLSDPYVLFLGFGDSSLNFELRAIIGDVDMRMRVISDINFAIDAAFREKGIEIPFPQRDLHVRDVQSANPSKDSDDGEL